MNMAVKSWQQCDWNSPYPERGRGLIAARPKGACRPPHALPRMPHAIRTPTNGVRTAGSGCGPAGTPVRPGSRKPLKSRGLREPLGTLIRVLLGILIRVLLGTLIRVLLGTLIRVPNRYPYKGYQTGTLIKVPSGTLIRVPNGTLIRAPRGSRKPLNSRGLREPGWTGVPAVHACPEGVQGLHALRTGVRTACGMRGFARLYGKAFEGACARPSGVPLSSPSVGAWSVDQHERPVELGVEEDPGNPL
ncbi:hypothetical protein PCANC_05347 [Puccinia coronata f. sp. avenae]|uniref:Uncharacterized protein n=1 Tax=Puccinia coronata f. sp. avenae TaxID=200324 RepID=A0A2N5VXH4_9BASI|nr:hypothetical protein PCANC_05347 [Puccinia coronata f. sp. avenae]